MGFIQPLGYKIICPFTLCRAIGDDMVGLSGSPPELSPKVWAYNPFMDVPPEVIVPGEPLELRSF